jgi:hypothetical protein
MMGVYQTQIPPLFLLDLQVKVAVHAGADTMVSDTEEQLGVTRFECGIY